MLPVRTTLHQAEACALEGMEAVHADRRAFAAGDELGTYRFADAERDDLFESFGRNCADAREQLLHRDCTH